MLESMFVSIREFRSSLMNNVVFPFVRHDLIEVEQCQIVDLYVRYARCLDSKLRLLTVRDGSVFVIVRN